MVDREKAIKQLKYLVFNFPWQDKPVSNSDRMCNAIHKYAQDAVDLLKAQEPRVTCSVCRYGRCLSGEWFCFMIGTSRYGKRVTDGDWYCKDAIGR